MTLTVIIPAFAIVLLAATVQSAVGFGFAVLSVPLLLLLIEVRQAIALTLFLALLLSIVVAHQGRRHVDTQRLWWLASATLLGTVPGAYLLAALSVRTLRVLIGITTIFLALPLLRGRSGRPKTGALKALPIGFVSGLLGSSTGMSGLPVVLFLVNDGVSKETFRSTMLAYLVLSNLLALAAVIPVASVDATTVLLALILLPTLAVGSWMGSALVGRLPLGVFRVVTVGLAILGAVWGLYTGLIAV